MFSVSELPVLQSLSNTQNMHKRQICPSWSCRTLLQWGLCQWPNNNKCKFVFKHKSHLYLSKSFGSLKKKSKKCKKKKKRFAVFTAIHPETSHSSNFILIYSFLSVLSNVSPLHAKLPALSAHGCLEIYSQKKETKHLSFRWEEKEMWSGSHTDGPVIFGLSLDSDTLVQQDIWMNVKLQENKFSEFTQSGQRSRIFFFFFLSQTGHGSLFCVGCLFQLIDKIRPSTHK